MGVRLSVCVVVCVADHSTSDLPPSKPSLRPADHSNWSARGQSQFDDLICFANLLCSSGCSAGRCVCVEREHSFEGVFCYSAMFDAVSVSLSTRDVVLACAIYQFT